MNIFVGNLAPTATQEDLAQAFGGYGTLLNVILVKDPATGEHRGYGHIFIAPDAAAQAAIAELNGLPLKGQRLTVRECIYRTADRNRSRLAGRPERAGSRESARRRGSRALPARLIDRNS